MRPIIYFIWKFIPLSLEEISSRILEQISSDVFSVIIFYD